MAIHENLPFKRGQTHYGPDQTIDTNNLGDGAVLEGKEYEVEDKNPVTGEVKSGRVVRLRVVRNRAGINLLPKRTVSYAATAAGYATGLAVDGYTTTTAARPAGVVDEYLPAAGVRNGDLFYIVVKGPTTILNDIASGANNNYAIGAALVALTAVTSQATTAGRLAPQDLTGATALLANQVQNLVGYAMSASTTAETAAPKRIDLANLK